jgi:hypothetical protein
MRRSFPYSFAIILSLAIAFQSLSAQTTLRLASGNKTVQADLQSLFVNSGPAQTDMVAGRYYRLAVFSEPLPQQWQDELSEAGVRLMQYIPDYAYVVSLIPDVDPSLLQKSGMISLKPLDAGFRMHPDLMDGLFPDWAMPDNEHLDVVINFHDDIPAGEVERLMAIHGLSSIIGYNADRIKTIRVKRDALNDLAALPFLSHISAIGPADEPENYSGKTLHRSNVLSSQYATGRKYDGSGVNVMLQDDGIIGPHIDYEGRIALQTMSSNSGDHGDHVAGTIMGAGNLDPTTQGMAPGADIYVYGAAPTYPGFAAIGSHYSLYDIRVTSTSYSNGCNAGYTSLTRDMDQQVRQLPALMHVFSAGNNGTSDCGYGAGAGWGNITGGHKMGKNVIAVANLDYKDDLSNSSSRGPANDGRIKPDVAAKGSDVVSTTDPNAYTTKSGTSMSCPGTSGTMLQLYHAYRELNGGQDPKGGLMKALLMNSADDIDNPGPDFKTGWGRINALKAVKALEDVRYATDTLVQGDTNVHSITVPAGVRQMKVMVYWTDYEAFAGAAKALVNDIDSRVYDPLSSLYMPWSPNPTASPIILNTPSGKGVDSLNNVEQVVINDPLPGNHLLTVIGKLIPQGPQEYFVTWEFLADEVKVTYPIGGEGFAPNENITLRWDAYGDTATFLLEYSLNNGLSWTTIAPSVPATRRYFNWTLPGTQTGLALFRVSRGSVSGQSEANWSIMGIPTNLDVEWACKDSFQLAWDPVPGAESYVVYMLGPKYMDTVGTTSGTSFIVTGVSQTELKWVSVSAVGPNDARGRRANAIVKNPGIWNCTFPYDMTIRVISPAPGTQPSCLNHTGVPVKVEITNVGSSALSNIPLSFTFMGNNVNETYSGTLPAGASAIHTFGSTVSYSNPGTYYLAASVLHQADSNAFNNTFSSKFTVTSSTAITAGQIETFDGFSVCSVLSNCEDGDCSLSAGWTNQDNQEFDDIDWRVVQGITPTSGTGPLGDHSNVNGSGNFLYLEPSGDCYGRVASVVAPCIDLSGMLEPVVDFWYNMYGADMGTLHVDLMIAAEWVLDVIPPISGNQGQAWKKAVVDLRSYVGGTVALRFRGVTGNGNLSDLAIDDIALTDVTGLTEDPAASIGLSYFPNPAGDRLYVSFLNETGKVAEINLIDMSGRQVLPAVQSNLMGTNQVDLDVSGLVPGTYLLRIKTQNTVAYARVQVVR